MTNSIDSQVQAELASGRIRTLTELNAWPTDETCTCHNCSACKPEYVGAHRYDEPARSNSYARLQAAYRLQLHREIHSTCEHGRTQDRHLAQ